MPSFSRLANALALTATIVGASPVPDSAASSSEPAGTSTPAQWNGCNYVVSGSGTFTSRIHVPEGQWGGVVDNQSKNMFQSYGGPYGPGDFQSSLVSTDSAGNLNLEVLGGTVSPAPSSQILTYWNDILYGSVRVVAKGDTNPGSVYGMFFYGENDTSGILSETDIELRTKYPNLAYYTDQYPYFEAAQQQDPYTVSSSLTQDISAFHEYRLDWVPGSVTFYIDGVSQEVMTQWVPTGQTAFYMNSWR